jgi:transposase
MTNKQPVDNAKLKPYLSEERKRLILLSAKQGLNFSDIARIFRIDKSIVTRIISANIEEYKRVMISE